MVRLGRGAPSARGGHGTLSGNPTKSACSRDAPLREIKVLLLEQGVVIGDGSGETDVQTAL